MIPDQECQSMRNSGIAIIFWIASSQALILAEPAEQEKKMGTLVVLVMQAKEVDHEGGLILQVGASGVIRNMDGQPVLSLEKALNREYLGDTDKEHFVKLRITKRSELTFATLVDVIDKIKKAAVPGITTRLLVIIDP
jgi:hypothetical protein